MHSAACSAVPSESEPRQLSAAEYNGECSLFFNKKQGNCAFLHHFCCSCLKFISFPCSLILSVTNGSVYACRRAHVCGHTHIRTGTHAQIHTACTQTQLYGHSLKVSAAKPILSVFLCALFPTVLVFFTPPVAMCHHLPSLRRSQSYLQTARREIQGQKFALGVWTVEQKYDAHVMSDVFMFCILRSLIMYYYICILR